MPGAGYISLHRTVPTFTGGEAVFALVAMFISRGVALFLLLCVAREGYSKPIENDVSTGRGIGSTLWGWVSAPFYWWSTEKHVTPALYLATTTLGPYDNVVVGNATVWCNDHTCTSMKCDKKGCSNVTCNIYDTDTKGQCREYNTAVKPDEPVPTAPVGQQAGEREPETFSKVPEEVTAVENEKHDSQVEEHPLEGEAVMSSTVPHANDPKKEQGVKQKPAPSPQNNVHDTDMKGQSREYNTIKRDKLVPTALIGQKAGEEVPEISSKVPEGATAVENEKYDSQIEEQPVELEAVMSSTVPLLKVPKKEQGVKISHLE